MSKLLVALVQDGPHLLQRVRLLEVFQLKDVEQRLRLSRDLRPNEHRQLIVREAIKLLRHRAVLLPVSVLGRRDLPSACKLRELDVGHLLSSILMVSGMPTISVGNVSLSLCQHSQYFWKPTALISLAIILRSCLRLMSC